MSAVDGERTAAAGTDLDFAVTLRELRLLSGLTQAELAARAGVGLGTIRDLEQGRRARPRAASLTRLAQALGLDDAQAARLAGTGPRARPEHEPGRPGARAGLWVQVLGPVAARRDGVALDIGSTRHRAVLALLALGRGTPVRRDALVDALWPDEPPPSAVNIVQGHISDLRRVLGGSGVVSRSGESYQLRLGPAGLDLLAFEELAGQAETLDDPVRSCELFERALSLWRGELAQDVAGLASLPPATALAARHAGVILDFTRRACETGQPDRALPELRALTGREPLNERAHAWLMTALAGAGQQAAALEVFEACRVRLDAELGVRPGPELAQAYQRILQQDGLSQPPAGPPLTAPRLQAAPETVPRQLPAAVSGFTGRGAQLAELADLAGLASRARRPGQAGPPAEPGGTVVISAIGGTGGVGKTALAVHWAHQVAAQFPDGQLYVNLRGYDLDEPVSAADALAGLLRAVGVPGTDIPEELEDRSRLYRSRLAGRRMLVLLDNAFNGDQVRPLLPGDPGCVTVVTSRDTLAGLVARDGARRLDLDVLPSADAVALLRSLIGARAGDDPGAVAELAGLCGGLPLALRIAAELAAARRAVPLPDLVAELAASRLDALDAGEDRADVRAVFSWSLRHLPAPVATAFALAGLHPGSDLEVHAVAALTGTTTGQARRVLGQLQQASLAEASAPDRYTMHDLLRAYAREQAAGRDSGASGQQALTRLFDYYLAAAAAAMDVLFPAENYLRPRVPPAAAALPAMRGQAGARAWLDREWPNLVAVVVYCSGHGWPAHATGLAGTLFRFLMNGSHLAEALTIYTRALQAARRSGDLASEASALNGLGSVAAQKGRFQEAVGHYREALERYRVCDDRTGEASVLLFLGFCEEQLHKHPSSIGYYRQALTAYEDAGNGPGVARTLVYLATVETTLGAYDEASAHLRAALPVLRDAGHDMSEAEAMERYGLLDMARGRLDQSAAWFEQTLAIFRRLDFARGVAATICNLGEVSLRQGRYQQAIGYLRESVAQLRETGYQHVEIEALRLLAEALHGVGQPAAARAELTAAIQLATELGDSHQQALAERALTDSLTHANQQAPPADPPGSPADPPGSPADPPGSPVPAAPPGPVGSPVPAAPPGPADQPGSAAGPSAGSPGPAGQPGPPPTRS